MRLIPRRRRPPIAYLLEKKTADGATVWTIIWPGGSAYHARVYPKLDQIFIETGARRQPASPAVAAKLEPTIRIAITVAIAGGSLTERQVMARLRAARKRAAT